MAELLGKNETDVAREISIDMKFEKIQVLENEVRGLKVKRHNLLTKSEPVEDIETLLAIELNLSLDAEAIIHSEIDAAWKSLNSLDNEVANVEATKQEIQGQRLQELIRFENKLSQELPKFRNALILYSDDYLMGTIEKIKDERENVESKINGSIPETKVVVPEIIAAITDILKLESIWVSSHSDRVSKRKQVEYQNKEFDEKIRLNQRKIAIFL